MRYALLICPDETWADSLTPDEISLVDKEYERFAEETAQRGILRGGERLRPATDATTVRVRNDKVLTTDGPFAETKEQMGGFFLVDCKDLDEAIEIASKIPGARHGAVEVRPIWEM